MDCVGLSPLGAQTESEESIIWLELRRLPQILLVLVRRTIN